jgi:hypothetical protein
MKTPSQIDWARLAAYIDGEGSIHIATAKARHWKRGYMYVDLRVTGTDARLALWLQQNFDGKVYWSKRKAGRNWKPAFHWVLACRQAHHVLSNCLPYFVMKRDQAEIAIAFQETRHRWGRAGAPKEVVEHQRLLQSNLLQLTKRGVA